MKTSVIQPAYGGAMTRWTADDIPDLSGRTAVVTGGNSGIGYHTVEQLARHGARVVVASRSEAKGRAAAAQVGGECAPLDLAELAAGPAIAKGVPRLVQQLVR